MKILIYGAGIIGSVYAARLHEAGSDVTLLARGGHYESLKENGVVIKNTLTGIQTRSIVPLIQQLNPGDFYDLIIVTVRLDQVETVMPFLKGNDVCPLIMFMLNNPGSVKKLTNELASKHIILGFPGVGGTYKDNVINYIQIGQQNTTIGEIKGEISVCIKEIKVLFERAGFKVVISSNMQAWLITHAIFVVCVAAAIVKENGDSIQLGRKKDSVAMMVRSVREGFSACKVLGMPIAPANLKTIFLSMPQWFSVIYWQRAMKGKIGTLAIAPHAVAAKDEMQLLAKKVLTIVHSSSVSTPTLDKLLLSFI